MGQQHISVLKELSLAPVEERVGDQGKQVKASEVSVLRGSNVQTSIQDGQTDEQNSQRKTYASVLKSRPSHGKGGDVGKAVGFAETRRMNV